MLLGEISTGQWPQPRAGSTAENNRGYDHDSTLSRFACLNVADGQPEPASWERLSRLLRARHASVGESHRLALPFSGVMCRFHRFHGGEVVCRRR